MSTKSIWRCVLAAVIMFSATNLSAQDKIDNLIQQIINNKRSEVTYSETRDPSTKKITESSHIINSTDRNMFSKLREAIEAERKNSVNYSQVGDGIITISFVNDNISSTYSLIRDDDGSWMLSANKQPVRSSKSSTKGSSGRRTIVINGKTFHSVDDNYSSVSTASARKQAQQERKVAAEQRKAAAAQRKVAAEQRAEQRKAEAEQRKLAAARRKDEADRRRAQKIKEQKEYIEAQKKAIRSAAENDIKFAFAD